jgi:hypothetical protein
MYVSQDGTGAQSLTQTDLLGSLFGHNKSILPAPHILARVHQHVPGPESGGDETAHLRNGRRGFPESGRRRREPEYSRDVSCSRNDHISSLTTIAENLAPVRLRTPRKSSSTWLQSPTRTTRAQNPEDATSPICPNRSSAPIPYSKPSETPRQCGTTTLHDSESLSGSNSPGPARLQAPTLTGTYSRNRGSYESIPTSAITMSSNNCCEEQTAR